MEERAAIRDALAQLPEAQRVPIEMAYYGGMTQVEISRALSEPLGTIKTRMRLGMQKLRLLLAGYEAEGTGGEAVTQTRSGDHTR